MHVSIVNILRIFVSCFWKLRTALHSFICKSAKCRSSHPTPHDGVFFGKCKGFYLKGNPYWLLFFEFSNFFQDIYFVKSICERLLQHLLIFLMMLPNSLDELCPEICIFYYTKIALLIRFYEAAGKNIYSLFPLILFTER